MRASLKRWEESTDDHGSKPEPAEMYDSDMQVYLNTLKARRPERLDELKANIELMKTWAAAGK